MFENVTFHDTRWFEIEDLLNEEWRDIKGYKGVYQVSNYGRIKRVEHTKILKGDRNYHYDALILKPQFDRWGYLQVHLCKDNKKKWVKMHRIEAETFLPHTREQEVNHINGNKQCNLLSNLEWVTRSENQIHAIQTGLRKLNYKNLEQYDLDGNLIATYDDIVTASKSIGISKECFYGYFNGRQQTLAGCLWKYEENA